MYAERVNLKFLDTVQQSEQMSFLAEISHALEITPSKCSNFTVDVNSNRKVEIVIWNPSLRHTFWSYIVRGYSKKLFEVTYPKDFDKRL